MSLVGSLEDLGLGDMLQIISLSGKSGLLSLHSERGEAQILFRDGAIRAAFGKGAPTDLRDLLLRSGSVTAGDLEGACEEARRRRTSLAEVLVEGGLRSREELDVLCRGHVEGLVLELFSWRSGEFSFDGSEVLPPGSEDLCVQPGINPQFLALEGARMQDEGGRDTLAELPFDAKAAALDLDAEGVGGSADGAQRAPDAAAGEAAVAPPLPARAEAAGAAAASEAGPVARRSEARAAPARPPVVVMDPELACLEWAKQALAGRFRVHIFQRSEQGVSRIRQYLARAEIPLLLLSESALPDALTGARDARAIARRLKLQSERMPIVLLAEAGEQAASRFGDALAETAVRRPTPTQLADPRRFADREALAEELRSTLLALCGDGEMHGEAHREAPGEVHGEAPREAPGEVQGEAPCEAHGEAALHSLLRAAAESFSRVALFAVREEQLVGIAQSGLPRAGGPDDAGIREIRVPLHEPGWVRRALAGGEAIVAAPSDAGDHSLAVLLGNTIPDEIYLAPIGAAPPLAFLYGDNLPGRELIGGTDLLEEALREATAALERVGRPW